MRKRGLMIALFIVGLAMLIPFNGTTWWGLEDSFYGPLFIGILAVAAVLAMIGLNAKGRERWLAFALSSAVLLGFSVAYSYSFGFILAPLSLAFLVISIIKLARKPAGD